MLVHGLGRLPKLAAFASSTVPQFSATPLPAWSVRVFATSLPFAETIPTLTIGYPPTRAKTAVSANQMIEDG